MSPSNKLYILCGIPFSGKSTLAKELAKRTGFTRIDLDEVKFEIYGKSITDLELQQEDWDVIYQNMYKQIEAALRQGQTVIHDTGNFTKHERGLVRQIAGSLGIEVITVYVDTPKDIAQKRLIANRETHQRFDVTDEEFEDAFNEMEAPDPTEHHIRYTPDMLIEVWIKKHFV